MILACGVLLPMVQSNGIGEAFEQVFSHGAVLDTVLGPISHVKLYVATSLVLLLGFIIFGGVKRIANFTQVIVPFMAFTYILISLIIIGLNIDKLPSIFMLIINNLF